MKTKLTFLITVLIGFMSSAQSIEKFSIDSGGAIASAGGIQIMYTIGEVNVAERTSATVSLSEGFISAALKIKINPSVFLQGPLLNPATAGLMNDILREDGLLPITSPYTDALMVNPNVFNLGGESGTGVADDNIVDWVWVELRASADTGQVIRGQSALLQRDGDIVGLDGLSDLIMPVAPKSYYVVVKHRNHLGAMSASTIALTETPAVVDFRDSGFTTFGNFAQTTLGSGDTALWAGDVDNSGKANFLGVDNGPNVIKDYVLADPLNVPFFSVFFDSQGYLGIDVDLNGIGKFLGPANDSNIIKDNVLAHPLNGFGSPFYTISATVPPEN